MPAKQRGPLCSRLGVSVANWCAERLVMLVTTPRLYGYGVHSSEIKMAVQQKKACPTGGEVWR